MSSYSSYPATTSASGLNFSISSYSSSPVYLNSSSAADNYAYTNGSATYAADINCFPPNPPFRREDALQQFETGRIKHLQEERLHIQKKTFTKWINSFLNKARLEVVDLFTDLGDGKMLLKLLEIISGEKLGKPNGGRMRVHKVENVNKSLAFLHTKVRLESIGAEDIVDGNPRLILGLIWTIILRFHIQEIEISLDEENESSEKKSAKDALLLWCQRKTAGYRGVNIVDFTSSWRNGMGFNALIHAHRSDLVDYSSLDTKSHIDNLNTAFKVAHEDLGIARILDAEDVDTNKPDEKSIITYVASYYHTFARMRDEMKGSRRIANIMNRMKDVDDSKAHFERITTSLLEWIRNKIIELDDRNFPNSLDGIQGLLIDFKTYRTEEKPPKYMECSEIEALFFSINASLKALNQPTYTPKDGQLLKDIEREWQKLVKAEHKREVALRDELMRQERLEHLAFKFEKKSVLRKGYLEEMIQVLSDPRYGSNLIQVDATVKKHEAISADILARQERFEDLTKMSDELETENYHGKESIQKKKDAILNKWKALLELLEKHKQSLQLSHLLMTMLREADTILDTIRELVGNLSSDVVGGFLLAVEDLIQKHALMESQVNSIGETIKKLNKQGSDFLSSSGKHKDTALLEKKLKEVNEEHGTLVELAGKRKVKLEESRNFYQFQVDVKEEEAWVIEKQRICQAGVTAKDLRSVMTLQQKHKALEDEMRARRPKSDDVIRCGEDLCSNGHPKVTSIREEVSSLKSKWEALDQMVGQRKKHLADAAEAYSFVGDANEVESWIKEKIPLVQSADFGEDELGARALLQLNHRLEGEIKVYDADIKALNDLGQKLVANGIKSLNLTSGQSVREESSESMSNGHVEELVPEEYWEEVVTEKVEEQIVFEEKLVDIVRSKYPFAGQGMTMVKGEEMILLSKTNDDWWNVRKTSGEEGFVPANYVRESAPRSIKVKVRKLKKTPVVQRVKRKRVVAVTREKPKPPPRRRPVDDVETVDKKLKSINGAYGDLTRLAARRTKLLEDSIKLLAFNRECLGFENWMKEKEKMLNSEDASDGVEVAKRKFEQFLTDMSAASKRVENIDKMAEELAQTGHSQLDKVRARQRQIKDQWDHLNRLKQNKERSLEGASSVELFHRTCDEARDWMIEKMEKLDTDELGRDLKTIQALQRKHDQLERELAPIEDKVNRVKTFASSVKVSYPNERKVVEVRQAEIMNLWQQLKGKAADRRNRLEEAVGNEIFVNASNNLLLWVGGVKEALNANEPARDVSTAEKLLEGHSDLGDDIRAHQDEFGEVTTLGRSLVKKNPNLDEVKEKLSTLAEEEGAINRGWQEKGDWLRQCLDLQLFNREADNIDASTRSHEAFLEFGELGGTIDDVEALLKRHDDFENTLIAQDERLRTFSEMASKLIAARHYDAHPIDDRRNSVVSKRNSVKTKSQERRMMLNRSMAYQQFKADADDFEKWMIEKRKTAEDESYKDLSNLERKLQKHEAFERELRANEGQLRRLNKTGENLMAMNHYRSDDVKETLETLNACWKDLIDETKKREAKLRQAVDQLSYNKHIEDTSKCLENLEAAFRKTDVGSDLRSCKDLLSKQKTLEGELVMVETKITEAHENGRQMIQNGHFDSSTIMTSCDALKTRYEKLKGPSKDRRAALEESLQFYEFKFQIEAELQWIKEHLSATSSEVLGQNLHEAQNLIKKHQKMEAEIAGHQPQIDKTLKKGEKLVEEKHPEKAQIEELCKELNESWYELNLSQRERKSKLELNLKAQNYFFEANEVEAWLNEKWNLLQSKDYGRDEDAARKKLTQHKAVELEIDTYEGLVKEMGAVADAMIRTHHPESKLIREKQQVINHGLVDLQKLSTQLRQKLVESMYRHEYVREADELLKWIAEQMQTASSEDFGQDYEHLLVLQTKYDDFKHRVKAASERFNQSEELSQKLVANENFYAAEIEQKQESLRTAWNNLWKMIRVRDSKLESSGEILRFNRDVADALSRIQEKLTSIPEGLGKDVHSVHSLIRKHDGFENDLVALEAQLQVLIDDASQLLQKYPDDNSKHITEQQALVVDNWNNLQQKTVARRNQLQEAEKFQKFLATSRDLMSWSSDLRSCMKTHEKVRDAASAQALKGDHERLKAEIETREDVFQAVVDQGQAMVEEKNFASAEIKDRVNKVLEERSQLHAAWQNKKVYLDQLIDLQFFLRDVKQLDSLCVAQEAALSSSELGETVEEVDSLVKKHLAFNKVIEAQEEKFEMLKLHGAKLIEQNHFYSPNIKSHIEEISERRYRVQKAAKIRQQQLEDAQLHAQFVRDFLDATAWIDEKLSLIDSERQREEVTSFEEKVKKLQKHQAFMAEIQAHESRITRILDKGHIIVAKQNSVPVKNQVLELQRSWKKLVAESEAHFRGLEEAQDILEFNTLVEKVEAWIRDKELLVHAGELGNDYEHCMALQRKLEDVDSDMRVDDARFVNLNNLADKIISQGRGDNKAVQCRREELNQKWKALKGMIDKYHRDLSGALEIHAFNRDVDDTRERIGEKASMLSSEESGRDLPQVELLQRKQESLLRDMTAIEKKIKDHEKLSVSLCTKYPVNEPKIKHKASEEKEEWLKLKEMSKSRQNALSASYTLHKFQEDLKELRKWEEDVVARMNAAPLPLNTSEAESRLREHQETKAEIEGRKGAFASLSEFGQKLLKDNPDNESTVQQNLDKLEQIKDNVNKSWEKRFKELSQSHQLQLFMEMAEAVETWLADKEAFLYNDDLGESIATVESLIRRHENFRKTFDAQSHKLNELKEMSSSLAEQDHYDADGIESKLRLVVKRWDDLEELARLRMDKLKDSKLLHQFFRNAYEVEGWIAEKMKVATDMCYTDPTNMQSKIQKHGAFEAELTANSGRVVAVSEEGEELISRGHYGENEIRCGIDRLRSSWRQLLDNSSLKKERLAEAYQALLYNRTLDALEMWMDDVETGLQSEDHGYDLTSVQNLLMKHQRLEADIAAHQTELDQAKEAAQTFVKDDHFMSEAIAKRILAVEKRYNSLQEPVQIRKDNLNDSYLLQQLLRDLEDEFIWLAEKIPQATSEDLGSSLVQVQKLQKKHQVMETEIQSHEPLINSLSSRAQQMIRSGHFASALVEQKVNELLSKMTELKDASSIRRLRLLDAVESQMFYSEAIEAETWMKEKKPLLTSPDFGKDENSVVALVKKTDNVGRDLDNFGNVVEKLKTLCEKLTSRGHFDSENVAEKMKSVSDEYQTLILLKEKRLQRLDESSKLFKFLLESDAVMEWLGEQTAVAASEDYGQDVEHIEILIQQFDSFLASLTANEGKVDQVKKEASKLLQNKHPDPDRIKEKLNEVNQLWEDLKELASARQEALTGAKQVHVFDRDAEETKSWIAEKIAVISTEDFGSDLETIQVLSRKHQGFERDLAAVKERVESVVTEAKRLAELFPDASEHISVKHEETVEAWNDLLEKSAQRKDKLQQAEELQAYFDQYRELLAWLNEILAKVTSPDLPKDVPGSEAVLTRHKEYKVEIDSRLDALNEFSETGKSLIENKHFMSDEISEKVSALENKKRSLLQYWDARDNIYRQNHDLRIFLRNAQLIENWIDSRESVVSDAHLGDSIGEVEDLIRHHDDFIKTVDAQEDKLDPIKRFTLIEDMYLAQKKVEEEAKMAEARRKEQERMEALKMKEVLRITDARRKEGGRRNKAPSDDAGVTRIPIGAAYGAQHCQEDSREAEDDELGFLVRSGSQTSLNSLKRGNSIRSGSFFHPLFSSKPGDLKRTESMKMELKKPKRTPSFTTRRRTQSFRKHKKMEDMASLPPVEIQGYLERKQELQSGGKKATIRSWKLYYTVLCGQLVCFFKDDSDFYEQKAASSPVSIFQARIERAEDYTKKKNVFRIITRDGAEYLLLASSEQHMEEWVSKLKFHANLPPSMQLLSYDNHKTGEAVPEMQHPVPVHEADNSSSNSTPETRRRFIVSSHPQGAAGCLDPSRPSSQGLDNPLYANLKSIPEKVKPVVPPRLPESSPKAASHAPSGGESPIYQNRVSVVPSYEEPVQPKENIYQNIPSANGRHRSPSADGLSDGSSQSSSDIYDGVPGSRQPYSEFSTRTMSLPPGVAPTQHQRHSYNPGEHPMPAASSAHHRYSSGASLDRTESSSEGDATAGKEGKRRGSVFKFLSRKKGAQV